MPRQGGIWPSEEQKLLLRAALMSGQASFDAWRKWEACIDVNDIDHASRRLLPLLYKNLEQQGISSSFMGLYKGVYRLTWYENQMLFHTASLLLHLFHEAGIDTILLKGAGLALEYYQDPGLRPMGDFDVLIHPEDAQIAVSLLESHGWTPKSPFPKEINTQFLSLIRAHGFQDKMRREFDLHWHISIESSEKSTEEDLWNSALEIQINGEPTGALNPTDMLLHVCSHGIRWNRIPRIRWIADAATILNRSPLEIDWERFIVLSKKLHLILPLQRAMPYLVDLLDVAIPKYVLENLSGMIPSEAERRFYALRMRPIGAVPPSRMLLARYQSYSLAAYGNNDSPSCAGFLLYLQQLWGINHLWQVPLYALFKFVRRVWQATLWKDKREGKGNEAV